MPDRSDICYEQWLLCVFFFLPFRMGVAHYIVHRTHGEQITCLFSSQVFRLKGKALKELHPRDHTQDVLCAKGTDLMTGSWSVSLSLMLWWDEVLEDSKEGCKYICMWGPPIHNFVWRIALGPWGHPESEQSHWQQVHPGAVSLYDPLGESL